MKNKTKNVLPISQLSPKYLLEYLKGILYERIPILPIIICNCIGSITRTEKNILLKCITFIKFVTKDLFMHKYSSKGRPRVQYPVMARVSARKAGP